MRSGEHRELQKIWDKEAQSYRSGADASPDYLAHFQEMAAVMEDVRGKKILDVGSGTGMTSAYLASLGAKVTLVDISDKALAFAQKYFRAKKLPVKIIKADAFTTRLPRAGFDVVWNGGVIEHFSDRKKVEMMKRMWRWVKPGGVLVISVPHAKDFPFMIAKQILLWRKKWAFGWEDDLTGKRLVDLVTKAGVGRPEIYAYNPVVGWWFFPWGREVTGFLGLNTVFWHRTKCPWGHNLVLRAIKEA